MLLIFLLFICLLSILLLLGLLFSGELRAPYFVVRYSRFHIMLVLPSFIAVIKFNLVVSQILSFPIDVLFNWLAVSIKIMSFRVAKIFFTAKRIPSLPL